MRQALREWTKSIVFAVVAWLLLRTFLVASFRITSGSMENTLLVADWLFVAKPLYGAEVPLIHAHLPAFREPRRGEILVFDSVEEPGLAIVKRLMGVPGDTLEMRGGALIRNREAVAEPYARHVDPTRSESPEMRAKMRAWQVRHLATADTARYAPDLQDWGPIVVPPDSLFMMGDNRDESYDGRYWGFLPRGNVEGTPVLIYFSYDPTSYKPLPFASAIRWRRILSRPK
jgi:signal peptidase I